METLERSGRLRPPFGRRGRGHLIRNLALALSVVSGGLAVAAQEKGLPPQSIDVVEVEVPVQVLVDGRPFRGLTREDFTLIAGGRKQEIRGFAEIDLRAGNRGPDRGTGGAETVEITLTARRHFLLLFDLSFASPAKVVRARDAALALLRTRLEPSDMVSVATFSETRGVRVLLGFTPDREQVERAIASLGAAQMVEAVQDPLGLVFAGPGADRSAPIALAGESRQAGGREAGDDSLGRALLEEQNQAGLRGGHKSLAAALTELAETLRPVAGRKHVLYLSEGAGSALLLGIGRGAIADERQRIEATNEASMRGEVWNVRSESRFGETYALVSFERMLKEFVRAGATIQAIDIGGVRATDGSAAGESTLFMMADKTGGEFIRNHNDLEVAMGRVLSRTAVSYLLSFEAAGGEKGGQYKRIKVKLNRKIRGATLHHRPGYFTPVPFAERSPEQRRAEAARWILEDAERNGLEVTLRVETSSLSAEGITITVAVAPGESGSGESGLGESVPASVEIYGYAIALDGVIAGYFDYRTPATDAPNYRARLVLEPGIYDVRVLVRDSASGATATRKRRVEIPGT